MIKISDIEYLIGNKEPESVLPGDSFWVEFTTWNDQAKGIRKFVKGGRAIKELTYEHLDENLGDYVNPNYPQ